MLFTLVASLSFELRCWLRWSLALTLGLGVTACSGAESSRIRKPAGDGTESGTSSSTASIVDSASQPASDCEEDPGVPGPYAAWDLGPSWEAQTPTGVDDPERTVGLVVEELTGDDRLDVFLTGFAACMLFAGTDDGQLVDVSDTWLPNGGLGCDAWGAAAGDIDGDDRLDLVLAGGDGPARFWLNRGEGGFVDTPALAEALELHPHVRSPSFGDYDRDGDLDLFLPGYMNPSREVIPSMLLRNESGAFKDASDLLPGAAIQGVTFLGSWFDADEDGDLDLYLINDFGPRYESNLLLLNEWSGDARGFVEAPAELGLNFPAFAMGNTASDLNHDGRPELVVPDIQKLHFLVSEGDGWVESSLSRGIWPDEDRGQYVAWGAMFADLDNDGLEDLLVPFGPTETIETGAIEEAQSLRQPDAVYRQREDGQFDDVAVAWGLDQVLNGRSTLAVDFDGDGWLDVFKREYLGAPTQLFRARPGCNRSISVHLRGQPGQRQAIGAKVVVEAGEQVWTRWNLPTNTGLSATGPARVHVGLGRLDAVDRVTVTWPSGEVQVVASPSLDGPLLLEERPGE